MPAMTDVEATYDDFIACRRYGRRNAILDSSVFEILPAPGASEPTDLPESLAQLKINKSGDGGEGSEKNLDLPAKENERQAEGK